jgi:hypothetical protein
VNNSKNIIGKRHSYRRCSIPESKKYQNIMQQRKKIRYEEKRAKRMMIIAKRDEIAYGEN